MKVKKFLKENLVLLYCTRVTINKDISDKVIELLKEKLNWRYILEKAKVHNIQALLYYNLKRINLKEILSCEVIMKLENLYKRYIIESLRYEKELNRILEKFYKNNLKVILFKGYSLEKVYSNLIYLRGVGDIDLLVRKEDMFKCEKMLDELGYVLYYKEEINVSKIAEWLLWVLFRERKRKILLHPMYIHPQVKIPLEIHTTVFEGVLFQKIEMKDIWENAQFSQLGEVNTLILSPEDMLLSLCPHLSINHNFELKLIGDITNIVTYYTINWEYVVKKSYEYRIKNSMYFTFYFAERLLDAPIPLKILDDLKPWRIKRILFFKLFKDVENFFDDKFLPKLLSKMGRDGIPIGASIFMAENIRDVIRIFTLLVLFLINKVFKGGIKVVE
ncbi:MAG: nucleotidyltransferase family protein [bacterium]